MLREDGAIYLEEHEVYNSHSTQVFQTKLAGFGRILRVHSTAIACMLLKRH